MPSFQGGTAQIDILSSALYSYQGQDRHGAFLRDGGVSTSGLGDLQAGGGPHKPGPAGAESSVTSIVELGAESGIGTEGTVDQVSNSASGLATTAGLHAFPVESVVPHLSGVVEQTSIAGTLGGWFTNAKDDK